MPGGQALADERHLMPKIDIDKVVGNEVKEIGSASHAGSQAHPVIACLLLRIFTSISARECPQEAGGHILTVREFRHSLHAWEGGEDQTKVLLRLVRKFALFWGLITPGSGPG